MKFNDPHVIFTDVALQGLASLSLALVCFIVLLAAIPDGL
jgi:hypothetical protein